jgi:hypothetical protein
MKKEYICEKCSFKTHIKTNYIQHLKTKRHNQDITQEKKYTCYPCSFVTTDRANYARHINTQKHKILTCDIQNKINEVECPVCGKSYTHSSSLSRHLKNCKTKEPEPVKMLGLSEEKIYEIIKNAIDKPSTNNNNNNNYNNYNKCKNTINNTFNLQLFLNEECKDAITLIDFVSNIKLKLKDLEDTAQHGFVETMTNIMTESLKELDITKRPIHSTDSKRGVVYVKDEDGWEKDKDHKKMASAINKVSNSNMRQISDWVKENPEANNCGTKENDKFMKILETTIQDDEHKHAGDVEKVIKKIAKSVTIDK